MADEQKAGFQVGDKFYPMVETEYTHDEVVAIEEISKMTVFEFSDALEEAAVTKGMPPMRVILGMLFVAMHRDDPRVSVKRFLQMGVDGWRMVGGEEDEQANPPQPSEKTRSDDSGGSDETLGSTSTKSSEETSTDELATPSTPELVA